MDNNNEKILWSRLDRMTELVQQHHSRLDLIENRVGELIELTRKMMDSLLPDEPDMDPVEADADALASAGYGTDEDYGGDVERL
tara:strand:+ start:354 stop:605 length:252 start_codon:yes stop_codon:yes gene_type:complete